MLVVGQALMSRPRILLHDERVMESYLGIPR
jgi:ABC-type branched-subunit amino acid transport system ATPase component